MLFVSSKWRIFVVRCHEILLLLLLLLLKRLLERSQSINPTVSTDPNGEKREFPSFCLLFVCRPVYQSYDTPSCIAVNAKRKVLAFRVEDMILRIHVNRLHVSDESAHYPVTTFFALEIEHRKVLAFLCFVHLFELG